MTTHTEVTAPTVLVVLGMDADNKPHASKFAAADRDIVLRAAGLMAFKVIELSADEVGQLKAAIPDGKVFATGKGFVPFVRQELYAQLVAKLGTAAEVAVPTPTSDTGKAPAAKPKPAANAAEKPRKAANKADGAALPQPWSDLAVGSTVLALDDEAESWFEAVVVTIADDDANVLRLKWRDYPQERQFTMHRSRVGVIGPGAR